MPRPKKYPNELVKRGIRLALESERPIAHIAADLGMHPETLRKRIRQHEADSGARPDLPTSQERGDPAAQGGEFELRRANEILKSASVFLRPSSTHTERGDPLHRLAPRPLRRRADLPVLNVSASAYYHRATGARSARGVQDERLLARIREAHAANYYAYCYRRTWKALLWAGEPVGRDYVRRLMQAHGICGAKRRGKPWRTTIADPAARRSPDLVNRQFVADAPDRLWVADFTYLRCWKGWCSSRSSIDVYSRRVVGWQLAPHMRTDLVLDALRMALARSPPGRR